MRDGSRQERQPERSYGRRRAVVLALVYVLFTLHILHWKLAGRTLAPLELNEVMYTLELGVVTAGFLFMCLTALGTLIFGRFFCSWGCHVLAVQDLCTWLLRKLGIRRPRQVRSRTLLWVPILVASYMFIWPQVARLAEGRPMPLLHLTTDADGWASFITEDFWRNLPGPSVTALTFFVCGFLMVYVLGSRSFCTYCCPYGVVFALIDRFAPGRIRATSDCSRCAECTVACTSGIRVHEEVHQHGMIINPACLKDLDCVAACHDQALRFGFGKPALFKSLGSRSRFGLPYDFSWSEDLVMAAVFIATVLIFRGLYGAVPFLMTLALGCLLAFVTVLTMRLKTHPHLRFAKWQLKIHGRVTRPGVVCAALSLVLALFVGHSALIRYHEVRGLRLATTDLTGLGAADDTAELAHAHLAEAYRWGLFRNELVERSLLSTGLRLQRLDDVERIALRALDRRPEDVAAHLALGQALSAGQRWPGAAEHFAAVLDSEDVTLMQRATAHQGLGSARAVRGDVAGAIDELQAALALAPDFAEAHAELGGMYAELGRLDEAVTELQEAVRLAPRLGQAHFNLGTLLVYMGRPDEAIPSFRRALETNPTGSVTLSNLGYALLAVDRIDEARESLQQSITIDPDNAEAHYNLARALAAQGRPDLADQHFRLARSLDPRFEQISRRLP